VVAVQFFVDEGTDVGVAALYLGYIFGVVFEEVSFDVVTEIVLGRDMVPGDDLEGIELPHAVLDQHELEGEGDLSQV